MYSFCHVRRHGTYRIVIAGVAYAGSPAMRAPSRLHGGVFLCLGWLRCCRRERAEEGPPPTGREKTTHALCCLSCFLDDVVRMAASAAGGGLSRPDESTSQGRYSRRLQTKWLKLGLTMYTCAVVCIILVSLTHKTFQCSCDQVIYGYPGHF